MPIIQLSKGDSGKYWIKFHAIAAEAAMIPVMDSFDTRDAALETVQQKIDELTRFEAVDELVRNGEPIFEDLTETD